jgi:lysyl-tRNA synthetase class 2
MSTKPTPDSAPEPSSAPDVESGLASLMQQRQRKADELRELNIAPYPNGYRPDTTVAGFMAKYADAPLESHGDPTPDYRLAGRLMAINRMGKAMFLRIQDATSTEVADNAAPSAEHEGKGEALSGLLQIYVRREHMSAEAQETLKRLDVGDIIGVAGCAMRTKTKELTLLGADVTLLTKALRPLPEKWHGLADLETRYRQRYVDLIVNPQVRALFTKRSQIIAWVRSYLIAEGFLEVETPMMHPIPGGAAARPFVTHHNTLATDLYLRIAPELYLKRLVVGGLDKVFEINRNFRNEGMSTSHNPEFTMLEFYEAYGDFHAMMDRAEAILSGLHRDVLGGTDPVVDGKSVSLAAPFSRMTMLEAIAAHGGPAPDVSMDPQGSVKALQAIHCDGQKMTFGQRIVALFEHYAEGKLWEPTIIYDFPADVSPLSRCRDSDPRFVDRFELYVCGRELANAFSELNDPVDQRARFTAQLAQKEAGDPEAHAMDEDYLRALEHGLPPTGGFGMGIDRLVMLLTGAPSIRDVLFFPQMRPER